MKKKPWKMTDQEFKIFYNEYGFVNGWSRYVQEQRQAIEQKYGVDFHDIPAYVLTLKEYISGHRTGWTPQLGYRGQYSLETAVADHRAFVEEALSEGIPIPLEVLKDYPDLQQQITKIVRKAAPKTRRAKRLT